jgi:hypothetical protein
VNKHRCRRVQHVFELRLPNRTIRDDANIRITCQLRFWNACRILKRSYIFRFGNTFTTGCCFSTPFHSNHLLSSNTNRIRAFYVYGTANKNGTHRAQTCLIFYRFSDNENSLTHEYMNANCTRHWLPCWYDHQYFLQPFLKVHAHRIHAVPRNTTCSVRSSHLTYTIVNLNIPQSLTIQTHHMLISEFLTTLMTRSENESPRCSPTDGACFASLDSHVQLDAASHWPLHHTVCVIKSILQPQFCLQAHQSCRRYNFISYSFNNETF